MSGKRQREIKLVSVVVSLHCLVLCVEFTKSQNVVVTGSADLTIKVWKLREGHCLQSIIASTCDWIRKVSSVFLSTA